MGRSGFVGIWCLASKIDTMSKAKTDIEIILKSLDLEYEKELQFDPSRKFRFDWAIAEHKIASEDEGLHASGPRGTGKSRHLTIEGYVRDCVKYNLAAKLGWRVLRYTATGYSQLYDDLKAMI